MAPRLQKVVRMEPQMAFLDDARYSGRNSYEARHRPWPREFVTLAIVAFCVAFWALVVLALT